MSEKLWLVYVVECSDGTLYTGIAQDVAHRIQAHNDGNGAKYTRGRRPVKLLKASSELGHGDALRLERVVKKQRGREAKCKALIQTRKK